MASKVVFDVPRKFKFVRLTIEDGGKSVKMHWGHLSQATGRVQSMWSEELEIKDLYLIGWALTSIAPYTQRQSSGLFRLYLPNGLLSFGLGREVGNEELREDYTYHGGRVMTYHLYNDNVNRVSMWLSPAECLYMGRMCDMVARIMMERLYFEGEDDEALYSSSEDDRVAASLRS